MGVRVKDKEIKKGVGKSGVKIGGKKRRSVITGVRRKGNGKGVRVRGS